MAAKGRNRKKRQAALFKRQHDFVFKKQTKFAPVTRDQIHGADYLLDQVEPYVQLLQNFNSSQSPGKEFFKCVMFAGPPGTGKTYFARYIATTAASGSEIRFVNANEFPRKNPDESWTAEDVRRLWTLLRRYAATGMAVVLFWDQFDGFMEDDDAALDQLYMEIDGIGGKPKGILFVAATTSDPEEDFDEQLMRAGRFNLADIVVFQHPTRKGRADIFRFYFNQRPHEEFGADAFAYMMHNDTTPADVCEFVNSVFEGAQLRARAEKTETRIKKKDCVSVIIAYLVGRPGAAAGEMSEDKLAKTAVHELGHAICARKNGWPVRLLSVIPREKELGCTITDWGAPEDVWTFDNARDVITSLYGAAVAETISGYERDEGAQQDYEQATRVAKFFVDQLGGGKRTRETYGNINLQEFAVIASEKIRMLVEGDVGSILKEEERRAKETLRKIGGKKLLSMAKILAKERVLLGEDFEKLLSKYGIKVKPARKF